jgi:hypothetical protein
MQTRIEQGICVPDELVSPATIVEHHTVGPGAKDHYPIENMILQIVVSIFLSRTHLTFTPA